MNGSIKPDIFYSDKLQLVEKRNLILAKSIYISVKSHYESRNNYQLSKTYKSLTIFSLSNADFPTLTPLSHCTPVSDCISVLSNKSVNNSFFKPVKNPSYISSIKPVPLVVCKCSVYNCSLGARNKCVHVSVNHTICKAFLTHFSECAAHVRGDVFKFVLSSFFVCRVSVPPVNFVNVTTALTYQYTDPASKDAIVQKLVSSTIHFITSPAPAVTTLNSSLSLHVCDVPVPPNLLNHVRKKSPPKPLFSDLTTTSRLHALIN